MQHVANLLNKAADLMETYGKANGYFIRKGGSMCLQGALMAAASNASAEMIVKGDVLGIHDGYTKPGYREAIDLLSIKIGDYDMPSPSSSPDSRVAQWNNFIATQEQAIAKLRETATSIIL